MGVGELVIGHGLGSSLVERYLAEEPQLVEAMRQQDARVIVFEPDHRSYDPALFFESMQRGLQTAEAQTPANVAAIYVAYTSVSEIVATRAFRLGSRSQPSAPFVPLVSERGIFFGYIAIGEGGVVFFDHEGRHEGPTSETVLAAIHQSRMKRS